MISTAPGRVVPLAEAWTLPTDGFEAGVLVPVVDGWLPLDPLGPLLLTATPLEEPVPVLVPSAAEDEAPSLPQAVIVMQTSATSAAVFAFATKTMGANFEEYLWAPFLRGMLDSCTLSVMRASVARWRRVSCGHEIAPRASCRVRLQANRWRRRGRGHRGRLSDPS